MPDPGLELRTLTCKADVLCTVGRVNNNHPDVSVYVRAHFGEICPPQSTQQCQYITDLYNCI